MVMQCHDTANGFLVDGSFHHDLDPLSAETVGETLAAGVATARAPPLADLNAHAEQSVQTDQGIVCQADDQTT